MYARRSFSEEIQFIERLEHPGVPAIYDVSNQTEPSPYIVMQLIDGLTLKDIIEGLRAGDKALHKKYHFHNRMDLVLQLLRVLSQVHEQGLIHRDIKPENLMIGSTGELYLMDWGIAIEADQGTEVGRVSGTPQYMSPEQYRASELTARSDIYSVGTFAYELMTLSTTVHGQTVLDLAMKVLEGEIKHAGTILHPTQGTVPSEFANPIMKALSLDPNERYQNAQEMRLDIARIMGGYFDAVCSRTRLKFQIYKYLRWIDKNPVSNLRLSKLLLLIGVALIFLGGLSAGLYM
jgi:serine/threonine-protein kinase